METISQLGPIATALAAIIALFVGGITIAQKRKADKRDQWWKRAQWALDLTLTEDAGAAAIGLAVLDQLARSRLATTEDLDIVDVIHAVASGRLDAS